MFYLAPEIPGGLEEAYKGRASHNNFSFVMYCGKNWMELDILETASDHEFLWQGALSGEDTNENTYITLQNGDTGKDVLNLKLRLQELGYFLAGATVSDSYNATCVERVKQFQKANGLPVTGIADNETQQVLFSSNAVKKPN